MVSAFGGGVSPLIGALALFVALSPNDALRRNKAEEVPGMHHTSLKVKALEPH